VFTLSVADDEKIPVNFALSSTLHSCSLALLYGSAPRLPRSPSTGHRRHVGVAHLLKIVGGERRSKSTAAIEDQLSVPVRDTRLDVAFDDAFPHWDRSTRVPRIPFALLPDIDEKRFPALEPPLRFGDGHLAHARFGVVDELEKTG